MPLIDPIDPFGQVTWLTVKGPPNALKDRESGGIVGHTTVADKQFSLLLAMGLGVTDLLHIGRRGENAESHTLDLWQPGRMFDTALLSGKRWYSQPGPEETLHELYVNWAGKSRPFDHNNRLNVDLPGPWVAHMSRTALGVMVGQVATAKGVKNHLTTIQYALQNGETDTAPGSMCIRVESMTFTDRMPFRMNRNMRVLAEQTLGLYQEHCAPIDIGKQQPYWETLHDDTVAKFQQESSQYGTWHAASAAIQTPWDFLAYCETYAARAGVAKGDPAKRHAKMLWRLSKHVEKERLEELKTMMQYAKQLG